MHGPARKAFFETPAASATGMHTGSPMSSSSRTRLRRVVAALAPCAAPAPSLAEQIHEHPERFTHQGTPMAAGAVGELADSTALLHDTPALRERMEADGYLLLRGVLDRTAVQAARLEVMTRLAAAGALDASRPIEAGIFNAEADAMSFNPDMTVANQPMHAVLRGGPMIDVFERLFGGGVRTFDYTWFRVKTPGTGTATTPHCDSIYMGRGTSDCYTVWTPFSDVSLEMGGLMVCEGSYRDARYGTAGMSEYARGDVDGHCATDDASAAAIALAQRENRQLTGEEAQLVAEAKRSSLAFPETQQRLRNVHAVIDEGIGPRWLTSTYEMGDILILSIFTLHASSDNLSPEIRLSSDTRYQLASEPADARWVGEAAKRNVNPHMEIMHKKGYVC